MSRALDILPDGTVLDGIVLAWQDDRPLPRNILQKRMRRQTVSQKLQTEAPIILNAFDLMEWQGSDIRHYPFHKRRALLEDICSNLPTTSPVRLSSKIACDNWTELQSIHASARANRADGMVLKHKESPYGDAPDAWRTWALDPFTINAVMIYAEIGKATRASRFTDFTFAVWNGNDLVPFAKSSEGLLDADIDQISDWVRKNTQDRFGPVRQVTPHHVFEISFDSIQTSPRRKSGIEVQHPRVSEWLKDASLQQAGTLNDLKKMLALYG